MRLLVIVWMLALPRDTLTAELNTTLSAGVVKSRPWMTLWHLVLIHWALGVITLAKGIAQRLVVEATEFWFTSTMIHSRSDQDGT